MCRWRGTPFASPGCDALTSAREVRVQLANICVQIEGVDAQMVAELREPLERALGGRGTFYSVQIDRVGRVGETLVSITGQRGRLPLIFGQGELEPGYLCSVVQRGVERFGL